MSNNLTKVLLILTMLTTYSHLSFASDDEDNDNQPLVGPRMMQHIKELSVEAEKPATLQISLSQPGKMGHVDFPVKLATAEMPAAITTDYIWSLISRNTTLKAYIDQLKDYGDSEAAVKINLYFENDPAHPLNIFNYATLPIH